MQIVQRLEAKENSAKNGCMKYQPATETLREREPVVLAIDSHEGLFPRCDTPGSARDTHNRFSGLKTIIAFTTCATSTVPSISKGRTYCNYC
ncbi:MAG: hypothetical protein ABSA77_00685 [Thermoguttaceae bacterium]